MLANRNVFVNSLFKPKILVSPIKNPQVCYNKAILKKYIPPKSENTLTGKNNDKTKKI